MHTWFECKVRYEKLDENGLPKKVTEPYLVDALSFTEAEARISKEMRPYISGEFTIANIRRANIAELFDSPSGDRWYRSKVCFTIVDMDKGKEKKVNSTMYVQASDIKEALDNLLNGLKGTLSDFAILSLTETMVLDVFPYVAPAEATPQLTTAGIGMSVPPSFAYSVPAKDTEEPETEFSADEYVEENATEEEDDDEPREEELNDKIEETLV